MIIIDIVMTFRKLKQKKDQSKLKDLKESTLLVVKFAQFGIRAERIKFAQILGPIKRGS